MVAEAPCVKVAMVRSGLEVMGVEKVCFLFASEQLLFCTDKKRLNTISSSVSFIIKLQKKTPEYIPGVGITEI